MVFLRETYTEGDLCREDIQRWVPRLFSHFCTYKKRNANLAGRKERVLGNIHEI
jgi:hypothetical protein